VGVCWLKQEIALPAPPTTQIDRKFVVIGPGTKSIYLRGYKIPVGIRPWSRYQARFREAYSNYLQKQGSDGRKQVLTCLPRAGRENLEDWKAVLRNLLERGLRRLLLLVQDNAMFQSRFETTA
jgi:hypothetical protein